MPLLFSYGTLRNTDVQIATFGRALSNDADALPGFEVVLLRAGDVVYRNAVPSVADGAAVAGVALEVTDDELAAADRYERPASYARTLVTLASGRCAWVYVHTEGMPQ